MNLTPAINAALEALYADHGIPGELLRDKVVTALDAAAPHIAAEAWAEGVRDGERNTNLGVATPNPYEETK